MVRNLRTAVQDIEVAREAATVAGRAGRRECAEVAAVDAVLALIEEGHISGASRGCGLRVEWQMLLEAAGLAVPMEIRGVSSTVELHARLLDWQEDLLRRRSPRRRAPLTGLRV